MEAAEAIVSPQRYMNQDGFLWKSPQTMAPHSIGLEPGFQVLQTRRFDTLSQIAETQRWCLSHIYLICMCCYSAHRQDELSLQGDSGQLNKVAVLRHAWCHRHSGIEMEYLFGSSRHS